MTTWDNQLLVFGGHGDDRDLTGARWFNGNNGKVASNKMASGRWYPGEPAQPAGWPGFGPPSVQWPLLSGPSQQRPPLLPPPLTRLPPPRAGVVTLPDGDVLIVGGVAHNGQGGWQADPARRDEYDNPTYVVFDPKTKYALLC